MPVHWVILPDWLYRAAAPTLGAGLLTLVAGLVTLHLYTLALWRHQQQNLVVMTDFMLNLTVDERSRNARGVIAIAGLGVETTYDIVPIDRYDSPEGCVGAVHDGLTDLGVETIGDVDSKGLARDVCERRAAAARRIPDRIGFLYAGPVFDQAGGIVALKFAWTTGTPPPAPREIFESPEGIAVAVLFSLIAAAIAYRWSRATQRQIEHLHRAAAIDGLTGVLRRESFLLEAAAATATARVTGTPLSALVIDLDRLKPINDAHGHMVGDAVLRAVADAVRNGLRSGDVVGRMGGDEFAALMRGADTALAASVAERVRERVEGQCRTAGGATVEATVSVGVATLRPDEDAKSLFTRADERLYAAKRSGRNQVIVVD